MHVLKMRAFERNTWILISLEDAKNIIVTTTDASDL